MFFGAPDPTVPDAEAFSSAHAARSRRGRRRARRSRSCRPARARLLVDGDGRSLDGVTEPPPRGRRFFGMAASEIGGERRARRPARPVELVHRVRRAAAPSRLSRASRSGAAPRSPPTSLDRAVAAAAAADAAVVVVGTNDDWETEGHDRDVDGPARATRTSSSRACRRRQPAHRRGRQRRLAGRRCRGPTTCRPSCSRGSAARRWPTRSPTCSPATPSPAAACRPRSRVRLEHTPSFGNFPGENGEVRYGEGVLVGYRWYETRAAAGAVPVRPRPVVHDVRASATPALSSTAFAPATPLRVEVAGHQHRRRRGSEVVQCYVAPRAPRVDAPAEGAQGVRQGRARPRASRRPSRSSSTTARSPTGTPATPAAPPCASGWSGHRSRAACRPDTEPGWRVDPGDYALHVGRSSADIAHVVDLTLE